MTRRIGLIVNPIAGMGGAVGLKGTDGPVILARAREMGAVTHSGERAAAALRPLAALRDRFEIITCLGAMGEVAARLAGLVPRLLPLPSADATNAEHTRAAARALTCARVELILFAGGDGTARDLLAAAGSVPVLGIPTGVKMRSAVFAPTPSRAGEIAAAWLLGAPGEVPLADAEIVDLDESDIVADRPMQRLHGVTAFPIQAIQEFSR